MKQNTFPYQAGLSSRLRKATTGFLPVLLLSLGAADVNAQTQKLHDFDGAAKNYSLDIATNGSGPKEAVQAGTIYDSWTPGPPKVLTSSPRVHFMNTGNNGGTNASIILDDQNFQEERAVSIVSDRTNSPSTEYYITAGVRGGVDGIEVTPVDRFGAVLRSPYLVLPSVPGDNIYPLHTIYHSNGNLYICGYITSNSTNLPLNPSFAGYNQKKAFVLQMNPTNGAVTNFITINTTYTTAPSGTGEDFDMAMRLVELGSTDIFVTGSVNAYSTYSSGSLFHSGVMNFTIDPGLTTYTSNHYKFDSQNGTPVLPPDEYGVDIVEGVNGSYYIMSNTFFRGAIGSSKFDIIPAFLSITATDNARVPYTGGPLSRFLFNAYDYAWGLKALPTCNTNAQPSPGFYPADGKRFVLSGQTINQCMGATSFMDDYRTFLWDVEVGTSNTGVITITNNNWTQYNNTNGTLPMANPYSYYALDREMNNGGWSPTFAARLTDADEIVLNAPHAPNSGTALLNNKTIHAGTCTLTDGPCSTFPNTESIYTDNINPILCGRPSYLTWAASAHCDPANPCNTSVSAYSSYNATTSTTMTSSNFAYTDVACGTGVFKQGTTAVANTAPKAKGYYIYPNPAQETVTVVLDKNLQGNDVIEIALLDVMGRQVGVLYSGKADGLGRQLQLPDVASGVYMVQLKANGRDRRAHV